MTKRLLSLALIAMMMAMLLPAAAIADEWTMYVYTDNGKSLNVRRDPMMGDNLVGSLQYGEAVTVLLTNANGWATIEYWTGSQRIVAYVQSRFLVSYKPAPKPSGGGSQGSGSSTITDAAQVLSAMNAEFSSARKVSPYTIVSRPSRASGWVNLRWAPSTEAERIASCPQGKELTVIAELRNWYQVQDPATGMIGFISRQYVNRK